IELFPSIGWPVVIRMIAGKKMEHGNLLVVEGHVVAPADTIGLADFQSKLARRLRNDGGKLFAGARAKHRQAVFTQSPDHVSIDHRPVRGEKMCVADEMPRAIKS